MKKLFFAFLMLSYSQASTIMVRDVYHPNKVISGTKNLNDGVAQRRDVVDQVLEMIQHDKPAFRAFVQSITVLEVREFLAGRRDIANPNNCMFRINNHIIYLDQNERTVYEVAQELGLQGLSPRHATFTTHEVPAEMNTQSIQDSTPQEVFARFLAGTENLSNIGGPPPSRWNLRLLGENEKVYKNDFEAVFQFFSQDEQRTQQFNQMINQATNDQGQAIHGALSIITADNGKIKHTGNLNIPGYGGSSLFTPRNVVLGMGAVGIAFVAWKLWQKRQAKKKAKKKEQARKRALLSGSQPAT